MRRSRVGLELFDPPGDLLPGGDPFSILSEGEGAQLLGNVKGGLVAMRPEHLVGTGPQLPFAQRHRWPRQ